MHNTLYLYEEGKDPEKEAVFVLEAPEMEDAAGEISFGVKLSMEDASMEDASMEEASEGILVTVTADKNWLDAKERVYPVRIDPTAIQVPRSAIHLACAEEGSPNTVIGDNAYPYVGYDDGITSGNLAGYGSKHRNCRTYFSIDYDFAALATEPEIVSASFQVTQKTRWSRGASRFGLYGVEEEWQVGSLNWNNQLAYNHYFLSSRNASTTRGEALSYDVTEEVSGWINGTAQNHGFVMKAMVEAPGEESGDAGVSMQCEVFYNNASAAYAPKLVVSWTGELLDLAGMTLDDTTIDVYPVVERNGDKSSNTLGVVAHGLAKPGSRVHYSLVNGTTGVTEAQTSLVYPDSDRYRGAYPTALDYNRRLSNWQSEVFGSLTPGQLYYVEAYAEGEQGRGATVRSDSFLIYREGAFDLMPRIAAHYGVELDTILGDMRMQDCLTKEGNLIFIRNPGNTAGYSSGELSEYYQAVIDGLLLGRAENCEFGYEPINLNTGNFYMEQQDAAIEDMGGSFALSRQYNSRGASYKGSLGYGWTFAYDERLGELSDGSVIWLQNNGCIVTFTKNGEGYTAPAGVDYRLREDEGGYTITNLTDGSRHIFDSYGLLTAMEDVQGNRTGLFYDMDFHLKQITSPSGKVYGITLDGENRIASVTLPDGYGITYSYDEADNLVTVTDQAGDTIRYEYDGSHYMTAWYDENGNKVVENVYDPEGRVVKQTDAEGGVVTLAYETKAEGGGQTTGTDAQGNVTVYTYDDRYRTTAIAYPDGTTRECSYNEAGYLATVKDRAGAVTAYAYDTDGSLRKETRQDGSFRSYTYNENNQVVTITDYDGGVTTYTYDEKVRPAAMTDAEGNVTAYAYDEQNRLASMTDPNGGVTAYTYEGACLVSMTDAEGGKWSYTYDAMNRLLTTTNPLGQTVKNTYDVKGRCVAETDAEGNTTVYTFDQAGAVTAITDKEGNKSTFTYDKMNRLLAGEDPLKNTLTYSYDKNGNKLTQTDAEGLTVSYEYDAMNRLVAVTDPEGLTAAYTYDGDDAVTSYTDRRGYTKTTVYDPVKKVMTSETDAEGNVTAYETDACGRTTRVTYGDGSTVSYTWDKLSRMTSTTNQLGTTSYLTYDACGNVLTIKDREDRVYRYAYDALNRLRETVDPLGNKVTYTYDGAGNLTAVTDARGNTTAYKYDALGQLTAILDACGGKTTYRYDKEGRVLGLTAPKGDSTTYTYDAIGQLLKQTDALGNVTTYEYDSISRLTAQLDALQGKTTYTYDGNGNVTNSTDAMGNTHTYETDEEGNLLSDTYPNGEKEIYTYDGNGNVLTYTDRYGVVTTLSYDALGRVIKASDTAGNEMTYTYDKAGNLLTRTDVLGRSTAYEYDGLGRTLSVTGMDGVITTYEYDALDRPVKITDGDGKVTAYAYDALGNLIHTTEPGEAEYAYTYDALNRLTGKVDPENAATTFVYDKNGNLTGVTDGNGVETAYAYDALNRLVSYTDGNGGNTAYTYDALSRLTAITTPEGLKESYGYDKAGNLLSVTDGLNQTTRYTYDDLYRLVRKKSPLGAVENYSYDSHDVVTAVTDALGNKTSYEVNANGQVTTRTEANGGQYTYTYDAVQRLTSITTPLGYETAFTYSVGDDILTESDSLGRTSIYEYDIMHRLIQVTDPEGGISTFGYDARDNMSRVTNALGYSYSFAYDKVDRLTTVVDPEEKATRLVYDRVGNITGITTPGKRTTSYTYDNNYNTISVTDPMGYVYGYSYDKDDRITGTLDPLAQQEAYTYDALNRLTAYTDKMGLTESYTYDAHGNVLEKTATDGLVTSYTYDLKNRLTSVTDPMGSTAYYTWDEMDNLTAVTDYMGRGTKYTYDIEGNLTSITDATGKKEVMTYDVAGRITSYTSNGGNKITYDYDKLNNLVEKAYENAQGETTAEPVAYAYDALGQRVNMYDSTGDTRYAYDGLGRITSVTTYRTPASGEEADSGFSHEEAQGDTIGYTYDEADNLSAITYPDGTKVSYEYDLNDNLIKVTDREGLETTYVYDAINRITEIHRPNGISTYNTYNARNQITELVNSCDDCEWVVSKYAYTYDDRGFIVGETAIESLAGYAYDDKHEGKHTEGKHDDLYPHGTKHAKHDKDATFAYQIVQTDRTFVYDDAGKLISATETEDNYGTYVYSYEYDLMGNRSAMTKTAEDGTVAEWHKYVYNDSNQLVSEELYDGKKTTNLSYEYDADGNRISETGKIGTDKVEKSYRYDVENRLTAVYDADELLMAAAYDGDGNRVFQLNYNLHTDEDWKGNSGNGNGSNKDNAGSGNSASSTDSSEDATEDTDSTGDSSSSNSGNNGNGNNKNKTNNGNSGNSSANNGKGGNGKNNGNTKNNSASEEMETVVTDGEEATEDTVTDSTGETEESIGTEDTASDSITTGTEESTSGSTTTDTEDTASASSTGNGNATNAEENNSQNQSGILFPIDSEVSDTEQSLIDKIKTTGKQKNYELIEYINDVNREYTEVLVEQNINGKTDTSYIYGVDRLSLDRFDGSTGYYLYDPRGSVTGITNEEGQIYQSYRYSVNGEITFGAPQYENEYTYNGESYNPNIESQYLRARYYDVVTANFLTEDSYLGDINEPLTLNRYNYCIASPTNYQDPSGYAIETLFDLAAVGFSIYEVVKDPSPENWGWLALDVVSVFVPFLAGSYAFKTIGKFVKVADKFDIVGDMMKWGDKVAGVVDKAASLGKSFGDELAKLAKEAIDTAASKCDGIAGDLLRKATTFLTETIPDVIMLIDQKAGCIDDFIESKVSQFKSLFGKADDAVETITDTTRAAENVAEGVADIANMGDEASETVEFIVKGGKDTIPEGIADGACFVAGTRIKTSDGDKCIEEIEAGDLVYAKNPETGESGWKKVVQVFVRETTELIHIQVGDEVIETTPTHPFWVEGYGFKAAEDLVAGDYVENAKGELLQVERVEKVYPTEPVTVYNFEVEDWHTYYVSEEGILVHNMCMMTPNGESGSGSKIITSQSQLQKQVERGQAPKDIDRVDKPHVPGQQPHVHFKDGTSLNQDGTIHDAHRGTPSISNKVREWLIKNGWETND